MPQNVVTVVVRKQHNKTLVSHTHTKQWDVIFCILYIYITHTCTHKCNNFSRFRSM